MSFFVFLVVSIISFILMVPSKLVFCELAGNETKSVEAVETSASEGQKDALKEKDSNGTSFFKLVFDKGFKWQDHRDILPRDYAQVIEQPAPVYRAVWHDLTGKRPVRVLDGGFLWVSLETPLPIQSGNFTWYQINKNEFVQKRYLAFFEPSVFKGIEATSSGLDLKSGQYGWVVLDTYTAASPGKQDYMEGELLEKYTLVKVLDERIIDGKKWIKVGKDKWVDGTRVARIVKNKRPKGVPPGAKWIDIDIYEQILEAYKGDRLIYATLVSSGLPAFETPKGLFRIWGKARMRKMSGGKKGKDYYFLEDVPYQMYFSNGVAIHGAYWHDNFGIKQSHGCVNISPRDAKWLFDWTRPVVNGQAFIKATKSNPGTFVYVH